MNFVRVLLLVLVMALVGAGVFYAVRRPGPGAQGGLDSLAAMAPQNTQAFLALDLRSITSTGTIISQLRAFLKDSPEALKSWQESEARVGVTADQFSKWTTPAGFLVVLAAPTPTPPTAEVTQEVGCTSNLKNIATGLEMYATDFAGNYPSELAMLTPNYLKTIPTCPAAQKDTYRAELAATDYTVVCSGHNHPAEPENFPQYNGMEGLVTKAQLPARSAPEAPEPSIVMGFPVTDVALAKADIQKMINTTYPGLKLEEKGNFTYFQGRGYGFVGNTLLLGSSEAALQQVVASCEGKAPNLTSVPTWAEARQQVSAQTGAFVFMPLDPLLVNSLKTEATVDEQAEAGLKSVKFLAGQFTPRGTEVVMSGLLGIDPQSSSPFAKTLLTPSNTSFVSAQNVPAEWLGYQAVDLKYLYHAVLAGLQLFPDTRGQVEGGLKQVEAVAGFSLEDDLFGGFTGELAYASRSSNINAPAGLLLLPLKDPKKAEKVLAKLDAVAGWKPGAKVGDVQLYTAQQVVKAQTPGLLMFAHGGVAAELLTEALNTKSSLAASRIFQEALKDHPETWIQASYLNTTQLKETISALLDSPEFGDEGTRKLTRQALQGYKGGQGLSWIRVDKDGLRLDSSGQGTAEITVGAGAIMAAVMVPNFIKARSQGQFTACKSNLKNIATAMEMYSTDYGGLYPPTMDYLTPNYLRTIPTCPVAGKVTYVGVTASQPDLYTIVCSGHNHEDAPENYPQFTAVSGLIERP